MGEARKKMSAITAYIGWKIAGASGVTSNVGPDRNDMGHEGHKIEMRKVSQYEKLYQLCSKRDGAFANMAHTGRKLEDVLEPTFRLCGSIEGV